MKPKHYNMSYLRGEGTTDKETLRDLKAAKPDLNVSEELCNTSGFVPAILSETKRLDIIALQKIENPTTRKLFTPKEAEELSTSSTRAAHARYKALLANH